MTSLRDRLLALSPTEFENAVFDLVVLSGLRNPVWRTPGADGGRDIEGLVNSADFSGEILSDRVYVECKRYQTAIDWPTVFGKLAYATNHGANILLICSPSGLSNPCKDEVHRHNLHHHSAVRIRYWDAARLASRFEQFPQLIVKYGLGAVTLDKQWLAFRPIAEMALKSVNSAYGSSDRPSPSLEFSASLSELLLARIDNVAKGLGIGFRPMSTKDCFSWMQLAGDISQFSKFDRNGFRTLIAAIRFFARPKLTQISILATSSQLELGLASSVLSDHARRSLEQIAVVANFELEFTNSAVVCRWRE